MTVTLERIEQPRLPAVPEYPTTSPWNKQIDATQRLFADELASTEGWEDLGEKQGVRLSRKYRENDSNPVPVARGETLVEGVEPYAFLAGIVQPPEMRKLWDARTETGSIIQRYSRNEVLFHAVTKGTKMVASPRDISGIQKNYVLDDGSCMIVQTSVETNDIPELRHTKRANLGLSGFLFKPEGPNTRVVYIFQIDLRGSIPSQVVSMVAAETPLCIGRARDLFYERGYAPYVRHDGSHEPAVVFQTETVNPHTKSREYRCTVTTGPKTGDHFEIAYDAQRMYRQEGGVEVSVEGDTAAVEVQDNGKGVVRVVTQASGKTLTVVLRPK